tara:strand:- start:28370 stop:29542 length:1173 start_codon:yes stop_codon:yes gene_type:complete
MLALTGMCHAQGDDLAGFAALEPRFFFDKPAYQQNPTQGLSPSVVISPEFRYAWGEGSDRITVIPFYRYDSDDENRTHWDLREANWQHFSGPWTWLVGMGKVFWGVAESRHLVDIVNQTDLVEDIDQEEKLGQPMIHVEHWSESGSLGLFLLPGFRERTFPANNARLRGPLPMANHDAVYDSGAGDRRVDAALRWRTSVDNWDIGLSGFYGTGREPRMVPQLGESGKTVLIPHYDVISQIGVDVQYTEAAWLWKLEVIGRAGQGDNFGAMVGGTEYTFYGVQGSSADLGLLAEYLYDARDKTAPPTSLDDDIFLGLRLTLNDLDDTNILAGAIVDPDDGETVALIEAQRRLGERWTLELELRALMNIPKQGRLYGIERDSYLTLRGSWYF